MLYNLQIHTSKWSNIYSCLFLCDINYTIITYLVCQVLHYDPFVYKLICCSFLVQKFSREMLRMFKNFLSGEHYLSGSIQIKHPCHRLRRLPRETEEFTISLKVLKHVYHISISIKINISFPYNNKVVN